MKIKRLVIENFKSIERIELLEPNPFTVFVGPNGSGKSNIFEALEFVNVIQKIRDDREVDDMFGGQESYLNRNNRIDYRLFLFECDFDLFKSSYRKIFNIETHNRLVKSGEAIKLTISQVENKKVSIPLYFNETKENFFGRNLIDGNEKYQRLEAGQKKSYRQFYESFQRIFIGNRKEQKILRTGDQRLSMSASNLERVLKRILLNDLIKEEIEDWLHLFIPSFNNVVIQTDTSSKTDTLLFYEQHVEKPFTKDLISDGTYNILALLTAIYQSNEPQFLCIEEPENGLNPKVVKELVNLCRYACEELGHFIWLNTHSQTLVSHLTSEEIVLVDKKEGATQIKQIKGMDLHGLPMDEAWLSNALGGGLPW